LKQGRGPAHVRETDFRRAGSQFRPGFQEGPESDPQGNPMLVSDAGKRFGQRGGAVDIPADDLEHGVVHHPVCRGREVSQFRDSLGRRVGELSRAIDLAERPKHDRQIDHRRNADILAEAEGEIAISLRIENRHGLFEVRARLDLDGETVAANEKIVSLFEPHADIIVKGSRQVEYGHKLNLTTGRSGLILDLVVEAGNPADSERFLPMLERHIAFYGEAPRQAAADGGYASRLNLSQAKALGVHDMAFHKKAGLRIKDMVKSNWVYRKLRNFRAGIESGISCLKRAFGLARCVWRGLDHFTAYVWSSAVAYNLALFVRLKPT
jgi:IS5 family transposase